MACKQFLALVCMVVVIASCGISAQSSAVAVQQQTGTLESTTPAGCLNENITQGAIEIQCFDSVQLNVTNRTSGPAEFSVGFADLANCDPLGNGGVVGNGTMTRGAGGVSTLRGELVTGTPFSGRSTPGGEFTVELADVNCSLTYSVESEGATSNATTTNVTAGNAATGAGATASTAPPSPAAAPAAPRNNALIAGPSAFVVMLVALLAITA